MYIRGLVNKIITGNINIKNYLSKLWYIVTFSRASKIGFTLLGAITIMAVFADFIAPYNPYERVAPSFQPPSLQHLLGTNDLGQDILSGLIYGARISLLIGFVAALIGTLIGSSMGIVAGYYSGIVDEILMRITDIWLSMPTLLFTIFLAAILVKTRLPMVLSVILAISLTSWPSVARLVRSKVLSIKALPYVEAARAIGASDLYIMTRQILPNVSPIIAIEVVMRTAIAMIAEASLSFLGLGDPTVKSWGMIIHYAMKRNAIILGYWWWFIPPGIMISLTVLALFLISIGLEEYLNPKLRR